ncbi:DUF2202 domain-containing protein [Couchioplanes caeruleus]|uniref:DUF2202 domain-containing protein n=1 Tax=Couchioplanes caeruleus TaxID=56438 RepID=UPI0020BF2E5B|nr:DUF2202 domain-containing protein [Couchioplanes caeruleus]UQU61868.1 DUF2202 domain-containing protein [Couchioplanes caeruleus]
MPTAAPSEAWRDRAGFCAPHPALLPSGPVRPAQVELLIELAQRTKLCHDLLAAFADRYAAFPQSAPSQTRELVALRQLLERHGLADPSAGLGAGLFAVPGVQARYDRYLAEGRTGRAAALAVVRRTAAEVVRMLDDALPAGTAPDVRQVCLHILLAAHRQIRVAQAWSPH